MTSISHYPHSLNTKYLLFYYIETVILSFLFVEDINVLKPLLCVGIKSLMVLKIH